MAVYVNPLDGPAGTAVAAGNGGGDPWSSVTANTAVYTAAQAHTPPTSALGPATAVFLIRNVPAGTQQVKTRSYFFIPAQQAAAVDIVLTRVYTSAAVAAGILARGFHTAATRRFVLQTRGSGGYVEAYLSPQGGGWLAGWYRAELDVRSGTSPTTGAARMRIFAGESTEPLVDSGWVTGIDTAGTLAALQDARHGLVDATFVDSLGVRTGADATDDPWPTNNPPTVTLPGPLVVTAGQPWSLPAVVTDDGTIASTTWQVTRTSPDGTVEVTSGLSGTTTATLAGDGTTTQPGTVLTATLTATDDDGASTTATTEVRVPTAGRVTTLGGAGTGDPWTVVGTALSTGAAMGDDDPTTGARSPQDDPATTTWRLTPVAPRTSLQVALTVSADQPLTGATAALLVAGVQVAQAALAAGTTPGQVVLTVPDPVATIGTDPARWADMALRLTVEP